ncbi:MAG: hypothetical protein KDI63_02920 [Gammaproteobacteria bacterium]|nr:hypothetical protein [Gammaproteobacteria bacterium]
MIGAKRLLLQILNYAVFMGLVGYFSFMPPYARLQPDEAMITLAISHAGERVQECRKMDPAEMAKLPPNMRVATECPRERSPVTVKVLLDKLKVIDRVVTAPGLYNDQGVDIYESVRVPTGNYRLSILMNDNVRIEGPTYQHQQPISLSPAQLVVIQFQDSSGQFRIK